MGLRRTAIAVLALLAGFAVLPRANGVVTAVGGVAYGLHINQQEGTVNLVVGNTSADLLRISNCQTSFTSPDPGCDASSYVELPNPGGSATQLVDDSLGIETPRVGFQGSRSTIVGTPAGTPYVQASSYVVGLRLQQTSFQVIRSDCTWDHSGSRASTTVVLGSGAQFQPAIGQVIGIQGGRIIFNEQARSTLPDGSEVIRVFGAHLVIDRVVSALGVVITPRVDIVVAASWCDPNIPELVKRLTLAGAG